MGDLNQPQKEAVEHGEGPMLILAGAGSGKTRVITHRVAHLIRRGTDPCAIVAVSFTNKAAKEMAERLVPLVGRAKAGKIRVSTFHSFGLDMLREEGRGDASRGRFVIFDQGDALGLVREILRSIYRRDASRRFDTMAILSRISNWKNAMVDPASVPDSAHPYDAVALEVYPEYEERLRAMRAFDFDDLICRPVRLMREDAAMRERWRNRIDHLLVDEFQDTSEVQLELVRLLANKKRSVCVVGDDDQSIYGWRGANVANILEFETHFPGAKVIKLETNYRSRAPILEVANAVISSGNGRRHEKRLRAARTGGETVRRCTCDDPRAEAQFVRRELGRLREENVSLDDVAVLYRSNQQARLIEEELTEAGLPYRLFGGQQFFDRKEVKDVAAYLRVVVNPWDEISLRRIINYPTRGIGTRTVQRLEEYAAQHGMPFARAFTVASAVDGIPDGAKVSLRKLKALFDGATATMEKAGSLHAAAAELVDRISLRQALDDSAEGGMQGEHRYQNVLHLLHWIERYEKNAPRDRRSLSDFLQRVTLQGDSPETPEAAGKGVTLCTLHAAKGLEFRVVFLIGCVEGQLPHSRTTDPKASAATEADLEEERRLFYVGITRAQDRLYLIAPRRRTLRGKTVDIAPSRYLDGLPDEHIRDYEQPEAKEMSLGELSSAARDLRAMLQKKRGTAPTPG